MKKTIFSLLLGSIFASTTALAIAGTFSVDIDIQNNSGNLAITEVIAMVFPTIIVDESTKPGARCYTNSDNEISFSELCRNSSANTPERHHGKYDITGSALAPISLTLSNARVANGMKFTPSFHGPFLVKSVNHTLSTDGNVIDTVTGQLELVDPAAVVSQVTTFTYDLIAAYN